MKSASLVLISVGIATLSFASDATNAVRRQVQLLAAVCRDEPKEIQSLIEAGANPHAGLSSHRVVTDCPITPFSEAFARGRLRAIDVLLRYTPSNELHNVRYSNLVVEACCKWNATNGVLERLVALGFNPRARDENGGTALHRAALYGAYELIPKLISLGVGVNDRDAHGDTPLAMALCFRAFGGQDGHAPTHDRIEVANRLLAAGAVTNYVSSNGYNIGEEIRALRDEANHAPLGTARGRAVRGR